MNAILIDDEKPALLHLERLLQADGRIRVTGKYTSAREGLDHLAAERTDVVFLDIEMPEMNGLQAAEYIARLDSDIQIVYTTAYSEYAIEAFELNAIDYLLKPIHPERLKKTVARFRLEEPQPQPQPDNRSEKAENDEPDVYIFKRLMLGAHMKGGTRLRWRTMKAQELFAYFLHRKGQWVDKEELLGTLWPEMDADKAVTHLHTSVYQVRKMLKDAQSEAMIDYAQESYLLANEGMDTDVDRFEGEIAAHEAVTERNYERCQQALALYRGDYLEEHDFLWAQSKRRELLQQYVSLSLRTAEFETNTKRERAALQRLLALQEKEPYMEEICRMTMRLYALLNEYGLMKACYETFVQTMRADLGVEPDAKTKQLFDQLMGAR